MPAYASGIRMGNIGKVFLKKLLDNGKSVNENMDTVANAAGTDSETETNKEGKTMFDLNDLLQTIAISDDENFLKEISAAATERLGLIAEKIKAEKLAKLKALAEELGIDPNSISLDAKPARTRAVSANPAPIRFRDTANPENTWSGRGRAPKWLQAYIDAGRQIDEFKVIEPNPAEPSSDSVL